MRWWGFLLWLSPFANIDDVSSTRSIHFAFTTLCGREIMEFSMSARGRGLFDRYVSIDLRHSEAAFIGVTSHVFRLRDLAAQQGVPVKEIVEEVGPLAEAVRDAKARAQYR